MENAADALKIAAFTLLFIGALSIAMITLSRAKTASEAIIYTQDDRNYYSFLSDTEVNNRTDGDGNRKVTIEAIIPSLYRYAIENYRIEFYEMNGTSVRNLDIIKRPNGRVTEDTNVLDLTEEQNNQVSVEARKKMVDDLAKKLISTYEDDMFIEKLGVRYEEDQVDSDGIVIDPGDPDDPTNANKTETRTIQYFLLRYRHN